MEDFLTQQQLKGIEALVAFKQDFAAENIDWLTDITIKLVDESISYNNVIDTFINTFCNFELADNDYMNIHLEANQYSRGKSLFANTTIKKILKHLTYIIWTDKLVDGYFPARVKDQTIYHILNRLAELQPLVFKPAA